MSQKMDVASNSGLPRCVDLVGLAADLSTDPNYRRLRTMITKALVAQSCASDLRRAQATFDAAKKLRGSGRSKGLPERDATEAALLFTCVSLYVRATWSKTNKGDRGPINIDTHLSPEQRLSHQALVTIRNKALAHVEGEQPIVGDLWHTSMLIAVEAPEGWKPGGASRSVVDHPHAWRALENVLPVATALVTGKAQRRIDDVTVLLNAHGLPKGAFASHLFDPIAAFGSKEAALALMPQGSGSVHVKRAAPE